MRGKLISKMTASQQGSSVQSHVRTKSFVAVAALAALSFVVWQILDAPTSFAEVGFYKELDAAVRGDASRFELPVLMSGSWELVCDSHGYDGDLYLDRYKRTYRPVGDAQDGAWGLIFIAADGSYSKAVGNCSAHRVNLSVDGCKGRDLAELSVKKVQASCSFYSPGVDGPSVAANPR